MKLILIGMVFGLLFYGSVGYSVRHNSVSQPLFMLLVCLLGMVLGGVLGLTIHVFRR